MISLISHLSKDFSKRGFGVLGFWGFGAGTRGFPLDDGDLHVLDLDPHQQEVDLTDYHVLVKSINQRWKKNTRDRKDRTAQAQMSGRRELYRQVIHEKAIQIVSSTYV